MEEALDRLSAMILIELDVYRLPVAIRHASGLWMVPGELPSVDDDPISAWCAAEHGRVSDGTRTRGLQGHNLAL